MPYKDKRGRICGFLNIEEKDNSGRFSRRYFLLDGKSQKFLCFMDNPNNLAQNQRIPIREIHTQVISKVSDARKQRPKIPFCFVVNFEGKTLFLQADDEDDLRQWIEAIYNASKITVPQSDIDMQASRGSNEWNQGEANDSGYKTEIAGGVVCKIPIHTSDDESDENDSESGSAGVPAYSLSSYKSGFCVKQGGMRKNWKRRFFVLNDVGLHYFNSDSAREPIRTIYRGEITSVQKSQGHHSNRHNLFEVETPKRVFYIQCDSPEEMQCWIAAIEKYFVSCHTQVKAQRSNNSEDDLQVTKVFPPHGDWV